jgi:hypothetical protein
MVPMQLRDAVQLLREDVEPNDLWRQRVLRRVSAEQRGVRRERRWSVRPWVAIAAGVACMAAGATIAGLVVRRAEAPVVAAAPGVPGVRFTLVAPGATTVSIVGDFNGWSEGALPLRRSADGRTWEIEVPLAPGRYAYAFVVDGRIARDPSAPRAAGDDFGTPNSVVMVRGS